jgi:hypothetical protein
MGRTVLIAFALAALSVSAANGLPDLSAKPQGSTASAGVYHKKTRHHANHATGHTPGHAVGRASGHESGQGSSRQYAVGGDAHAASLRQLSRAHQSGKSHPAAKSDQIRKSYPALKSLPSTESDVTGRPVSAKAVTRHKTRAVMPPPLRGSFESLARQNVKTENDNLERIEDNDDLVDRIARNMLVPVPASTSLTVNGKLPENFRYCRPWTARFLADLARAHVAVFHRPLEVSSAVRTVEYQKRLMKSNGNAAAAEGDIASPHLTGATVDIAKQGMSRQEMGWMRSRLLQLQQAGKIDVEEEFHQACFHITVYKSYLPPKPVLTGKPKQQRPAQPVQIATRGQ